MNTVTIKEIRKQVKKSIDNIDDTTVQMIHAMLEVSKKNSVADEVEFDLVMQRRINEFEAGTAKTFTFDEIAESARKSFKKMQMTK